MKTNVKHALLPLLTCLPLAVVGCHKSGTEAQRDVDQARAEQVTETTGAKVDSEKKIAEAQTSFGKTREDYRHDMNDKLLDLNDRIAKLDAKALKATGHEKAKLDARLPELHTQRDAFVRDYASIENDTAATWDSSKKRLDKEWSALKDAVDKAD